MRLLLDTHTILWFQKSDEKLSIKAKNLINDPNNTCYLSIASLWEMAIKVGLNKLEIAIGYDNLYDYLLKMDFKILDIKFEHLKISFRLPDYHRDPFDRLFIAQAISEDMSIVTADRHFADYPVEVIW